MRFILFISLCISSLMLSACAATNAKSSKIDQADRQFPPQYVFYKCANIGQKTFGTTGRLDLHKRLNLEGEYLRQSVSWRTRVDSVSQILGQESKEGLSRLSLVWSGEQLTPVSIVPNTPFNWNEGRITLHLPQDRFGAPDKRDEKAWPFRQIIISRNNELSTEMVEGDLLLNLPRHEVALMSELRLRDIAHSFNAPLETFLAYVEGAEDITLYKVAVTEANKPHERQYYRQRKILSQTTLDLSKLKQNVDSIRQYALAWESGLSDYKAKCVLRQSFGDYPEVLASLDK